MEKFQQYFKGVMQVLMEFLIVEDPWKMYFQG